MKYVALPTWIMFRFVTYDTPDHPHERGYRNLGDWAYRSPLSLRLLDAALYLLAAAAVTTIR